MEFLVRCKLTIEYFINQILADASYTVIATACIFVFSIFFFFLTYWFLDSFHQISLIRYKNINIIGSVVPLPAFQVSDSLKKRLEVKAKNDLRVRDFFGNTTNVSWQSFSQDDSISRQFPTEGNHWRDFHDQSILGLTPKEMVEDTFKKYGLLKYQLAAYRDNSFDILFPIKVMQEYFRVQSIVDLQNRINSGQLNPDESALFQKLSTIAPQIRTGILQQESQSQLFWLSETLKRLATESENVVTDKERFRNIFYGEVLSILAPPGTQVEFFFDSLPLTPEPMDFLYMSTTIATSNIPGEIVPITNDVRLVMWFQLMISYFILALNVAAIIKWLKLE